MTHEAIGQMILNGSVALLLGAITWAVYKTIQIIKRGLKVAFKKQGESE